MPVNKFKNSAVIIVVISIAIIITIVRLISYYSQSSSAKLNKNDTQILDLPEYGISIQFPKEFENRPLLAFYSPQYYIHLDNAAIGGNFYTQTGAVIRNPHMDEKGEISNAEINCKSLEDVKKDDWFIRDN